MRFSTDKLWVIGLCLGVIVLLLPMLAGWRGIFLDDYYETFSRLLFNARSVQSGSLPLWDNQTFAGGRINFIPNTTIWYWPLYPLYLLTPSGNVDGAYAVLVKIPLLLHWLACALGAFLLGRGAMKLRPEAAAVLAAVYSLGAAMSYNILDPSTAYATAWLPFLIWGTVSFARRPSPGPLIAGAAAFAFIGPCGSDVRGIFSLATAGLFILVLSGVLALRRKVKYGARILFAAALVALFGILLSAPYWTAMVETVEIYRESPLLETNRAASEMFSLPWPYLLTMLVPDAFGTLTGRHAADLGVTYLRDFSYLEGNITGGFWLLLLCLAGALAGWRTRSSRTDGTGVWWWAGLIVFAFSLLLITGRYSAPYRWLSRTIALFGLPYAARWRILHHLGLALLAGVSAHWLGEARSRMLAGVSLGLLLAALGGTAWAWFQPEFFSGGPVIDRAWHLYRGWFLSGPILYLVLAAAGVALLVLIRRGNRVLLVSAVFIESFLIAFAVIYFLSWGDTEEWVRYRRPTESRYQRLAAAVHSPETPVSGAERSVFDFSLIDQVATTVGGEYLFGHCSKPLAPRLYDAVDVITEGYPYALRIRNPASAFFPNMSVGRMVLENAVLPEELAAGEPIEGFPGWTGHRLFRTMPRVFTQETVVVSTPEEAFEELMTGDLRRAAYVEKRDPLSVISDQNELVPDHGLLITDYELFIPAPDVSSRFEELQRANRIRQVSMPSPTRMVIEIEVGRPALLVTTDVFHPGWRVSINGVPARPLRVNYLQRGVVLTGEGRSRVEWAFRPAAVRYGLLLAGFGALSLIAVCAYLKNSQPQSN